MTDEQRKRIHKITYSCDDRAELAERIVTLEDENKKLCDKNMLCAVAKRGIRACYDNLSEQYKELESENAKLREFAQAMAEVAYEGQMLCDRCRFFHGCYNGGKRDHEGRGCQWLLWARELGIEVEDD